ncbi:MAG: F0F1 ATP synthase subunit B [Taibaiella sp.]|nr:F0F1 ATP synthase subunit B [Taibaiella sp.]
MSINWFTVIAQIVNFLVLAWLLKRFLYKPVLNAIDEREKRIASQIGDAEKKEADAKTEKETFRKKNEDFDRQRTALIDKALEETKAEKQRLLEEARKEATDLSKKMAEALKENQENLVKKIAEKAKDEVFVIVGKTLKDLANIALEQQIVDVFTGHLKNLNENEKKDLGTALAKSAAPVIIRTTFDITAAQQPGLEQSIKDAAGTDATFKFQTVPELISGIELNAGGYKIAWSISEYLESVKNSINEITGTKTVEK